VLGAAEERIKHEAAQRAKKFHCQTHEPPMESPGAVGEPLPPTPAAAMAGLRRSEKPSGLAGTRPITHPEVRIGEVDVEDRRVGQVETNRAVVIAGGGAAGLPGGSGEWTAESGGVGVGTCGLSSIGPWALGGVEKQVCLLVGPADAQFSGPSGKHSVGPALQSSSLGLFLFSIPYFPYKNSIL